MFANFRNSLKVIIGSSLILSGNFFIQPHAAQAGNFSLRCYNEDLIFSGRDVYLDAYCQDRLISGYYHSNTLISGVIANYNGNLAWAHNGDFTSSCIHIYVQTNNNSTSLIADCRTEQGVYKTTAINLDSKINNTDGHLSVDNF